MQFENGVQFLNTTFLLLLFAGGPAAVVFGINIVPLANIYAPL